MQQDYQQPPPPPDPNYPQPPPQAPPQQPPPGQYQQPPPGEYQQPQPMAPAEKKSPMALIAVIVVVIVVVAVLALVFMTGGGGNGASGIEGTWNVNTLESETMGVSVDVPLPSGSTLEFNADGTSSSLGGYGGNTWSEVDSDTISWGGLHWDYSISGNSMDLTYEIETFGISTSVTYHCTSA